ncbi:MAG: hypothetical protein A2X08_07425 [Bacteroidetes bacterium GWA2_32_17]|nr:MAG: hypothetical protein A2X08_07425 [Bacteroidetes bacterium GWA2_32_17]
MDIIYKTATANQDFEVGKILFQQYSNSLNIDLSFQDFETELKTINKQYNKPKGALLLVYNDIIAIGCAGIRELDKETAELKRMYILPEFRGHKIGQKLLELSFETDKNLNYNKIRLDTLPNMIQAQNLYRSLGFYEIHGYRYNPVIGTVYMEKIL